MDLFPLCPHLEVFREYPLDSRLGLTIDELKSLLEGRALPGLNPIRLLEKQPRSEGGLSRADPVEQVVQEERVIGDQRLSRKRNPNALLCR